MTREQRAAHLKMLEALRHVTRTHEGLFHDPVQGKHSLGPLAPSIVAEVRLMVSMSYAPRTICTRLHIGMSTYRRALRAIARQDAYHSRPTRGKHVRNRP